MTDNTRFVPLAMAAAAALVLGCQQGGGGLSGDDGETGSPADGTTVASASGDDAVVLLCEPDEVQCADQDSLQRCAPTGLEWLPEDCPVNNTCVDCDGETCMVDHCEGPCESNTLVPSSAGCSFIANRQLHLAEQVGDSVIVANPNESLSASVKFWRTPEGKRKEELVDEIVLEPLTDAIFEMNQDFVLGDSSMFRTGGIYRVESDVPVIAYQHAPGQNYSGNDSSMLLPENTLGQDYVVASYYPHAASSPPGRPSYFEIVALEDYTTVEWTPPVPAAGNGLPIPPAAPGETASQSMNRFDTIRVAASANFEEDYPPNEQDVSGTIIHSDKPIWVVSGSRCSRVPVRETPTVGFCDPLQEVMIPLRYWGDSYVAPHPPLRDTERHFWRIYAGADMVSVTIDPPILDDVNCAAPNTLVDGSCVLDHRGSWIEVDVENGVNLRIEGDGPFMPVGYLQSRRAGGESNEESTLWGDPAMYQVVPTAQFLDRYVIRTAIGYPHHFVQLTRPVGGANVIVDSDVVQPGEWQTVGEFEVATHEMPEGTHVVFSSEPFGVIQIGLTEDVHYRGCTYTPYAGSEEACATHPEEVECNGVTQCVWEDDACIVKRLCRSSYAYPGGMKSEPIFIP